MEEGRKRIISEFKHLVSMTSLSFKEDRVAAYIKEELKNLGFELYEDCAGSYYHGTANNIYGFLKGTIPGEPILFSAHMDTVLPGKRKKAIVHKDGTITSSGATVLGADDVAGIVEILEALREIKENHIEHRDIEVLFTIAEEAYVKGSAVFDFTKIKSSQAYVLDLSGKMGLAATKAPSLISFQAEFCGKEAHAGFEPENGIHAILMASEAIAKIKMGHIDQETTVNIGKIEGGKATNIIPDRCSIEGEIRSFYHERAIQVLEQVRASLEESATKYQGSLLFHYEIPLKAYCVPDESRVVQRYKNVVEQMGLEPIFTKTFGGSDNHTFLEHGISGVVIACGMHHVHTCEEYTTIEELIQGMTIVKELMTSKE